MFNMLPYWSLDPWKKKLPFIGHCFMYLKRYKSIKDIKVSLFSTKTNYCTSHLLFIKVKKTSLQKHNPFFNIFSASLCIVSSYSVVPLNFLSQTQKHQTQEINVSWKKNVISKQKEISQICLTIAEISSRSSFVDACNRTDCCVSWIVPSFPLLKQIHKMKYKYC